MFGITGNCAVIFAVALSNNTDPNAQDQVCDIGKPYVDCVEKARLYTQTSYYQKVEVIEFNIVNRWSIKND